MGEREIVRITNRMRNFIETELCFVGTADETGKPNVVPKGSLTMLDERTLIFAEGYCKKTFKNLEKNSKITVTAVNRLKLDGYQFKGTAEILREGPLYEQIAGRSEEQGWPRPPAAIKINVTEIYLLRPGSKAGEKVA